MNPSRTFVLRPVATSLLMVGVLLAGVVAYRQLPVSALPEVDYPTIQVATTYPGASPDVMASSVTAPLERQFGQMPGLQQMTSSSSSGLSIITLQFALELSIDVAEQEVQQSINAAGTFLPADLPTPPLYSKINPADTPILTLALTSNTMPLSAVEDLADTRLAPKISQLPGVGLVTIGGGQKPAIRIQANPGALASYGLNLEDVRSAIAATNVNQAKGSFDGAHQNYQIGANDQLLSSGDYASMVVAYRNGAPVRLRNVATVVDSTEDLYQSAMMNRTPAVIVNVQRQPGANIIGVVDRIKTLLPTLTNTLPAAIHVTVLTDRTNTIRASVKDVEFELMLTIALVVMVIFLFLRTLSATVIPGIAVPLSLIGTFAVMYLLGYSLNNLTLMALTISTGFVVDDAIVMIENIARFIEQGEKPLDAALKGSEQIGFTIISLTVSLIAVLIPLLFMGDIVGRLFREFAVTLAVTILISAVVSLTLTPMMAVYLLRHTPEGQQGRLYRWSEHVFERVIAFYGRTLDVVFRHQTAMLLGFAATLALTVVLFLIVPKGFFPVQDTGVIQGVTVAAQTVSFPEMVALQQRAVATISSDPAVESLSSFVGIDQSNTTLNNGRVLINLKAREDRSGSATDVIRRLQPRLAGITGLGVFMQPVQDITVEDRVSRTQFQYTLEDPNAEELNTWAPRLLAKLDTLPALRDVASDQQALGLRTQLVFNRELGSRLGVTPAMIDQTLYDSYGQRQVSTMFTQLNQYHVILEVAPQFQRDPLQLNDLFVRSGVAAGASASGLVAGGTAVATTGRGASTTATTTSLPSSTAASTSSAGGEPFGGGPSPAASAFPSGNQLPVNALMRVESTTAPITINHQGQFPVVTLSFNLAPGASLGSAVQAVNDAKDSLHMPTGIQGQFQGAAAAFESSLANEPMLILAAVITVYIVLGVLYESYIHPLTILSTLPSAGVGALVLLLLTGTDFGIISLIGLVLLIGIVKKNAIMMIDFALEAERQEHKPPLEAIREASLLRFRPIMMTTLAALFGGIPLALGTGTGSELRRPLGIAIVGGLLVSQLLTLYTTPVIYLWFDRLAARLKTHAADPGTAPDASGAR
jgi:multidrug efflux pump